MPLARHDGSCTISGAQAVVSTHMPLARHDFFTWNLKLYFVVSTHMPLARHDEHERYHIPGTGSFYSHASARHDIWGKVSVSGGRVSTHMPLARHDLATLRGL